VFELSTRVSAPRRAAAPLFVVFALAAASSSFADDKQACVSAYQDAQSLRKDDKLRAAKEQLVHCASDACPAVLSRDCTQWLREVEEALPSVVLTVTGPDGNEAVDVHVTLDGAPLVDRLEGHAVTIDPGVHTLRFVIAGSDPYEQRVVIREGEKLRPLAVAFPRSTSSAPPPPSAPPTTVEQRPIPTVVYPFAAVGIVGLAGFGAFALDGLSKKSTLDQCRPNCAQSDVDSARRTFLIGDLSLAVGVVSLAAAAYFFFDRPSVDATASSRTPRLDVMVGAGGATVGLRGGF
jgi:hypothetical protein